MHTLTAPPPPWPNCILLFVALLLWSGIEKTKPADAELDDELLASKSVRDGIAALKQYRKSAISLQDQFAKDGNMNLIPVIRKEFDFSKLRDDLNVVTTVFDDQTQLTTDQRTRSIIYDLTELENAARLKKGDPERTPKKIANVQKVETPLYSGKYRSQRVGWTAPAVPGGWSAASCWHTCVALGAVVPTHLHMERTAASVSNATANPAVCSERSQMLLRTTPSAAAGKRWYGNRLTGSASKWLLTSVRLCASTKSILVTLGAGHGVPKGRSSNASQFARDADADAAAGTTAAAGDRLLTPIERMGAFPPRPATVEASMLASTPAPDLRDWGALSTGSIVIPGVFFWYLTRTSATLSRFSVLGGLCFVSVRTRSKLTFGNISVRYQKNARSFTIHVYMNGADGFGEHRSRPGAATRRLLEQPRGASRMHRHTVVQDDGARAAQ
ncbi:hypothetical protein EMIHUDRAFT_460492 [Emiliania huxleyi CCMP1516]|uniref:Uncharacterized protein n=2 Tax=Emiliania huxleyi TaxID=2903 RepID=A0A0D3KPP0_EMIH1|nr:hypothetical protein EMIHUDRAFT_460492 [Emiliania huxleyi CCMP1516]EOD37725.1 hypothetical protein EMIHUDRAFT_460492 [Emiliania huxleyi CCMP1516]|eukprot:XP_005790154.1 hypothetical protein EMIHUDRAFT_460492 [Emiliania huxleyi CCMP1516]